MATISTEAEARQAAARRTNGEFGHQNHAASPVTVTGGGTLADSIAGLTGEFEDRLERLAAGYAPDQGGFRPDDPQGERRAQAYREAVEQIETIRTSDLSDGEMTAALADLGADFRSRGLEYYGAADEITVAAFDHRAAGRLASWGSGIQDTDRLTFDYTAPANDREAAALHKFAARLKLSGISGSIRDVRLSGRYKDEVEAIFKDDAGREFVIEMEHRSLTVERENDDLIGDEYRGNSSVGLFGMPVTPKTLADAVKTARRGAAVTDGWIAHSGLKSNDQITFLDQDVIRDGFTDAATVTAETGGHTYRIERILDRRHGRSETRIHDLGDTPGAIEMTGTILDRITAAAGAPFTRDMVEYRLDSFIDAVSDDSGYRGT